MTIKEQVHQYLTDNGLWDHEADIVLDSIAEDKNYKALSEVFHKPADDYSIQFFAAANMTVRHQALDWIDANKPMHFAQYIFSPDRRVFRF